MAVEREIKAKEIVKDIVSGIGDNELMHKYKLTFRGLQDVYKKLVDLQIVDAALLEGRIVPPLSAETTVIARLPRKEIYVPLPVQDKDNPGELGIVIDLTERGVGVKGLKAEVGETRTLMIRPDKFLQLRPFAIKAKCRWVKPADDPQEILAGFETISIGHGDLQALKNLIETLEYMYR